MGRESMLPISLHTQLADLICVLADLGKFHRIAGHDIVLQVRTILQYSITKKQPLIMTNVNKDKFQCMKLPMIPTYMTLHPKSIPRHSMQLWGQDSSNN